MKLSPSKISENLEDLIQSLRSRLDTLQSQHISFVSFCSNLINSHISSIHKEVANLTSKSAQLGITKCLENLKASYEKFTSDLEFSFATKSVQEAIQRTQKQVMSLSKQNFSVFELEKKISAQFASLSEVVNRKILKAQWKKCLPSSQLEAIRNKKSQLVMFQKESKDFKEKIETLEQRIICLSEEIVLKNEEIEKKEKELDLKEKELLNLTQEADSNRVSQKHSSNSRLKLNESNNLCSIFPSPLNSPIHAGNRKQFQFLSSHGSPEQKLSIENFRSRVGLLSGLLEKFNLFNIKLDEAVSNNPELAELFSNLKSVKSELSSALKGMMNPKSPCRKGEKYSDAGISSEVYSLKSENCKLKADLNHKLTEILELSDQTKRVELELRESKKNVMSLKQEISRLEKNKEEAIVESLFIKSQLEKTQKTNKFLSETIATQEKKNSDFILLQSKYDEIIKGLNIRPKSEMKLEVCFRMSLQPKRKTLTEEKLGKIGIEAKKSGYKYSKISNSIFEEAKNNENIFNINRKLTLLITEKGKVEEELLQYKENVSTLNSQISLLENLNKELNLKIKELETNLAESALFLTKTKKNVLSSPLVPETIHQQYSFLSKEINKIEELFMKTFDIYIKKISSLHSSIFYIKNTEDLYRKNIQESAEEIAFLQKEKLKLLETRDKLIIQCNSQSEEIISLKLEQGENLLNKNDEKDSENKSLKNRIFALQLSENNLLQALKETTDKYTNVVEELSEKDSKIETINAELTNLRFIQSIKSANSIDRYKGEIYNLKMKNIKLEQAFEEINNNQLTLEEFNNIKATYIAQISKVDEEKAMIEKKLKDSENLWTKEKENLNKSLDSFAKQLAGANLEISNLKTKIKDLNFLIKPSFNSNNEFRIIRVVEHETNVWFLVQDLSSHFFCGLTLCRLNR